MWILSTFHIGLVTHQSKIALFAWNSVTGKTGKHFIRVSAVNA